MNSDQDKSLNKNSKNSTKTINPVLQYVHEDDYVHAAPWQRRARPNKEIEKTERRNTAAPKSKGSPARRWRDGLDPLDSVLVDKLALTLSKIDVEATGESLQDEAEALKERVKRAGFKRTPASSKWVRNFASRSLPSRATISVGWDPIKPGAKQFLTITLNPSLITEEDVEELRRAFVAILGREWRSRMRRLFVYRVDVCRDGRGLNVNNLIVRKKRGVAETKFVHMTDGDGRLQTLYLGSAESDEWAAAYDQNASDAYKAKVGEKVSVVEAPRKQRRPSLRASADDIVQQFKKEDRTRVEARHRFSTPVPLQDVDNVAKLTENIEVFYVPLDTVAKGDTSAMFLMYVEGVRLRGFVGTEKYLTAMYPTKEMKQRVKKWEARLLTHSVPWWPVKDETVSLANALKSHPAWGALRYIVG